MSFVIPRLAREQDATLSVYSVGETYISQSPHARIVREAMGAAVVDSVEPGATDSPLCSTAADEAEPYPANRVASDPSVIDTESDPSYRDRVENHRQSRLSRWQEQR